MARGTDSACAVRICEIWKFGGGGVGGGARARDGGGDVPGQVASRGASVASCARGGVFPRRRAAMSFSRGFCRARGSARRGWGARARVLWWRACGDDVRALACGIFNCGGRASRASRPAAAAARRPPPPRGRVNLQESRAVSAARRERGSTARRLRHAAVAARTVYIPLSAAARRARPVAGGWGGRRAARARRRACRAPFRCGALLKILSP